MKKIKVKFWCNAGHTEEQVEIEIYKVSDKSEEQQIEAEFHKWLDQNEEVGWEKV